MLQPLPWHLTGEVAADKRPVNSLLKQETEFDSNTKQGTLWFLYRIIFYAELGYL